MEYITSRHNCILGVKDKDKNKNKSNMDNNDNDDENNNEDEEQEQEMKNESNSNNSNSSNNEWVMRYFASSELWLFDKRGLRNDDIANGIGRGDVLSPLDIQQWEIHNGRTFILCPTVKLNQIKM
jgi:hypothetical protein